MFDTIIDYCESWGGTLIKLHKRKRDRLSDYELLMLTHLMPPGGELVRADKLREAAETLKKAPRIPEVRNCARCGGDHEGLIVLDLEGDPHLTDADGDVYNHYTLCPINHQPILVYMP